MRDYLIQNKTLSLEKIGVLTLSGGTLSQENGESLPQVEFTFDKKATTTEAYVQFVTDELHKNRSIIESDIDYFLDESRQLMNIGTSPLAIPGIGYIHPLKTGGYAFSQENISALRDSGTQVIPIEDNIKDVTETPLDKEDSGFKLNDPYGNERDLRPKSSVNYLALVVILLLLIGVGYAIYYFVNQPKSLPTVETIDSTGNKNDTASHVAATHQTEAAAPAVQEEATVDPNGPYKFIFETTTDAMRAKTRTAKLRSYGDQAKYDSLKVNGVLTFRLYIPIKLSNDADTTRAKDSLFKYFQKPITVTK